MSTATEKKRVGNVLTRHFRRVKDQYYGFQVPSSYVITTKTDKEGYAIFSIEEDEAPDLYYLTTIVGSKVKTEHIGMKRISERKFLRDYKKFKTVRKATWLNTVFDEADMEVMD